MYVHQPIVLFSNDDLPPTKHKYITIKSNTDEAKALFCTSFENKHIIDQLDTNIHNTDPNHNYEILERSLIETQSECFPDRVVRFNNKKHKKTPWATQGILNSINQRNRLYKRLKQTKTDAPSYEAKRTSFNKYRNLLKKTITHAKCVFYKNLFDRYKNDMRKTWSIISDTLNKKVKHSIPDIMSVNGEKCSDKARISEHFNSFFATIGSQNENNIRRHEGSTYKNYLTNQYDCTFAFHLINNNDTLRIIKNIKMSHSKGYDGISTEHLKLINKDISKCLTLIINQSLNSGIFPDKLKIAKVTPIYKKGDKQIITNYRPISVLPVISKIFETVIHEQL